MCNPEKPKSKPKVSEIMLIVAFSAPNHIYIILAEKVERTVSQLNAVFNLHIIPSAQWKQLIINSLKAFKLQTVYDYFFYGI